MIIHLVVIMLSAISMLKYPSHIRIASCIALILIGSNAVCSQNLDSLFIELDKANTDTSRSQF